MLVKCICTNCAGHLEFEEENAGETIKCPHCAFNTVLFLPGTEKAEEEMARLKRKLQFRRYLLWAGGGAALLAGAGWALNRWLLPLVESLLNTDSKVVSVLVLACILLTVPLILAWFALPIFLFFQFRKLTALLAQLEINLRPQQVQELETPPDSSDSSTFVVPEDELKL